MKLAFILDPIAQLDPTHDSTVALMEAACTLGHEVYITEIQSLNIRHSKAWAWLDRVHVAPITLVDQHWVAANPWYTIDKTDGGYQCLEAMDAVWMRVDPPVTTEYLYATYILDYIDPQQTLVINAPAGIRAANEKMYAMQFTTCIPETIVTSNKQLVREFVQRQGKAVMKPLGGKGGEGILFLTDGDPNFSSLTELSTNFGKMPVMVQAYLPEAIQGDKRIIVLAGQPLGAVNRIPAQGEFRGNMAAGGRADAIGLTPRDREICAAVAPALHRDGLIFVGLDVIGGYLTEVNVTSPTGIREIDRFDQVRLGEQVIKWLIEQR